ncbi:MAG: DUF4249 domain-containing protein [Algibacter sp.]|uniref:DUF4249 domain-containing protein n=1 Tax=Algibacter sp. TaxID=1872428 RepID=UPI00260FFDC6|nr:DUF4249 domain-containing protein [Algibacter sp.]MDG1729595.1 DUF4249 domain-containing protein [Algibacter sp.]MDG2178566.1 DUF4249 domain-containing protein [Algibacter sp.]
MKKIIKTCLIAIVLISCEDVIDVDLNSAEPRLVIDASLHWIKGTNGANQLIKLSLTAPYFDNNIPPATGANVTVSDSNNNTFIFTEENNSGIYKTENFLPVINEVYNLNIVYDNENYTATETMIPVVPIEFIEQKNDGGFSGDEIEIKAYYTDPENIDNFYLFEFLSLDLNSSTLEVYDDEFTDGNQIFAFFSDEDLETGNQLLIRNSGVSERTYEFLNILLQQTDEDSGDPFQIQPATVRGNCINQTNPDNFPLGYFRVSETDVFTYIVE